MFFKNDKPEHVLLALMACLGVYLFVFMYLQISSIPDYRQTKSFDTYSELVQEQVELTPNNIERDAYSGGDISSVSRDLNDQRIASSDDWSESQYEGDPKENAKEIERQLFESTGEKQRREELLESHNAQLDANKKQEEQGPKEEQFSEGQYSGNVMVEFELQGRTAYKKDNWYVRNPGYTCGTKSNGVVVVQVRVNRNGNVVHAQLHASTSKGLSDCMIDKAIAYAKKSRFNYASASAQTQTGTIKYQFIAQ